ncbi:5-oxoprolinase subunit B family protein [Nesterenkonia flava]|uniref:Carboxyltransferase domain-containing protein n=1 Tax=Nesterenkonia flava TaxID=469799 RepID=A0ABU1FVE8_9MICC|nr:carboxyltransferase domain-containing protein [Nesterenkonia flava]MDR5712237.1 carboxyltransferase domain-containing protein [Nesterenkonia flava]
MSVPSLPEKARCTYGGDEFLFVEIDEAMSLAANVRAMTIARGLQEQRPEGLLEICPANASLLLRVDPDVLDPRQLETLVRELEEQARQAVGTPLPTRIVEVPVWYQDPYTDAVVKRFREGYHQDPSGTDLDYAAAVNGLSGPEEFIRRHHEQPWLVTMVGFVAGLPFMFQLVDQEKQLQVPKYLSPRPSSTPQLTVGHGGCFGCIYSVEGAGGYQMFGLAAGPIFDPSQQAADLKESMIFFRPGDIVKFRPVDEEEYRLLQQQVEAGTFTYRTAAAEFDPDAALTNGEAYNRVLLEALS